MSRRPLYPSRPASVAEPSSPDPASEEAVHPAVAEASSSTGPGNVIRPVEADPPGHTVQLEEADGLGQSVGPGEAVRPMETERPGEAVRPGVRDDAEERIAFLASAGELLSTSLEWRTVLQRLAELAVPVLADWCAVDVLGDDGRVERVAAAHREPAKVALIHELSRLCPLDVQSPGGISEVLRTGTPMFLPEVSDGVLPGMVRTVEQFEVARRLGIRAGLVVPLLARGRVLGAVSLVRCREGVGFQDEDLKLALELARRASLSMDNALLYAEAREAQVRTERLQAVTAALSRAVTAEQVAEVLMSEGLRASGAVRGNVFERVEGGELRLLGTFGYTPAQLTYLQGLTAARMSLLGVDLERHEPQWFTRQDARQPVSDEARTALDCLGEGARAVLPLRVERGVLGFLVLAWDAPRAFSRPERAFLEALAQQCAQALERASLYETLRERGERLRHALEVGKEAEERLFFLLEASRALAEHLDDVEWTLEHVARVAASSVATCCLVELVAPDGALRC
ncbi:GAF domain-containing protein, partial [Pyxidicoccus sp. 3LG]